MVEDQVLDAAVFANVEVPGIAGSIFASFRRVFHSRPVPPNRCWQAIYAYSDRVTVALASQVSVEEETRKPNSYRW